MTNVQRSRRQVRLSRALGIALTPKAQRIFEKRPYAPGEHGRDRRRTESDYAVRMREKQRLRAQYGISEKQLRAAYEKATRTAGQTGNAMLTDLETRLDNLVLRAGFARTTAQARQFVVHRHILVDGNIVDRPSYRVKPGQTIQVKAKSQTMVPFQIAAEGVHRDVLPAVPGYLDVNLPSLKATVTRKPEVEEIPVQVNIQYVVEFYARSIRALWSTNPGHTARTPRFFREAAGFLRCRAITGRTPPGESSSRTHRHRSYSDECRHR